MAPFDSNCFLRAFYFLLIDGRKLIRVGRFRALFGRYSRDKDVLRYIHVGNRWRTLARILRHCNIERFLQGNQIKRTKLLKSALFRKTCSRVDRRSSNALNTEVLNLRVAVPNSLFTAPLGSLDNHELARGHFPKMTKLVNSIGELNYKYLIIAIILKAIRKMVWFSPYPAFDKLISTRPSSTSQWHSAVPLGTTMCCMIEDSGYIIKRMLHL